MRAVFDVLEKWFELRPAVIFQLEPPFRVAPGLIRSDVAAFDVTLWRPAAQVGQVSKRRGALLGRFLGAGEVPFFAQPRRHAGAEAEAANQFVL